MSFTVESGYHGALTDMEVGDQREFPAELKEVTDGPKDGQFGPSFRLGFDVYIEGEAEPMDALASKKFSKKSKFIKWAAVLMGRALAVDESFELDDIIGKPCRAVVEMQESGYPRIVELKKAPARTKAVAAA